MGYPNQALSHELVALAPGMKLAGPAFTVKGTVTAERDTTGRSQRMKMVCSMTYPCVEVRDRGTPFNVAIYAELSATTARAHGAVGAVSMGEPATAAPSSRRPPLFFLLTLSPSR